MNKLALIVGSCVLAFACTSEAPSEDDGNKKGSGNSGNATSSGAGAGEPTPDPTVHWTDAEMTRMTEFLASDELAGREEGSPGGIAAREFVINEMNRCGITPHQQQIGSSPGVNVIGVIEGSDETQAGRHILIGAHYDHIGECGGAICNGANDNAAAVAIMLGVGCAFAENPPAKSIILAAFDAEEPPTFLSPEMGSQFYANNPIVPLEQTDAALIMDLVGADLWPGFDRRFVLGSELSPEVQNAVVNATVPEGLQARRLGLHLVEELATGHQPWSDYDAFRNLGKPVLFFAAGYNRQYHTPNDDMSFVNVPAMVGLAGWLHSITVNLAETPEVPAFVGNGADYVNDAEVAVEIVTAALAEGGLIDQLGLSAQSRSKLQADLDAATTVRDMMAGGGTPDNNQIRQLRNPAQRIMCYTTQLYPENTCNLF